MKKIGKKILIKTNQTYIKQYANYLFNKIKLLKCEKECQNKCNCDFSFDVNIIDKVDNIPVQCYFSLEDNLTTLVFIITSKNTLELDESYLRLYQYYEKCRNYKEDFPAVLKFCRNLAKKLPKLKLQLDGTLEKNSGLFCEMDFFHKMKNIQCQYLSNCSVCSEKTLTKTCCMHPLCIRCMFSLKINDDSIFCPLCREDITIYNKSLVEARD